MRDRVLQPVDVGWVDPEPTDDGGAVEVAVVVRGDIEAPAVDRGRALVAHLAEQFGGPVLFARLKLSMAPDPAVERPATAEATIDVARRPVRARVSAATMAEALDALDRRLRDRLAHFRRFRDPTRTGPEAPPGEWRHGLLPTARPEFFDRAAEERTIVRHKTFSPVPATPDEAAFDLEAMDLDFHLFRDLRTGHDAVIWRSAEGDGSGYRLQVLDDEVGVDELSLAAHVVADGRPVPQLDVDEAVGWLDATGDPFVFFAIGGKGRGAVVYRRYDGHYGLLTTG